MSRPASSPPHAPPSPPGPTRAALPGLRWILAIALVKGLALTALIPPFQTPDEYAHYDYAVYLSRVPPLAFLRGEVTRPTVMRHAEVVTSEVRAVAGAAGVFPHLTDAVLPKRQPLSDMLAAAAAWDGRELDLSHVRTWNAAMNYPPLYHGALAVLLRVQRAAGVNPLLRFYSARLCSIAMFLLALWAAAAALRHLDVPPRLATTALGVIALQPQLSMMTVSVQPDVLALLLVTAAFAIALGWWRGPSRRRAMVLGATLGALLLTKPHDVPPLLAGAAALAAAAMAAGTLRRLEAGRQAALIVVTMGAAGGWWLLRSRILYDNWMGMVMWTPAPGASTIAENLATWWHVALPLSFRSYWGVWGWLDYGVSGWMVGPLLAWTLLPAALLALRIAAEPGPHRLASWARGMDTSTLARSACLAIAMAVFTAEMLWVSATMGLVQAQGRQWLPFVLPQALYLALPIALMAGRPAAALGAWARRHARGCALATLALGALAATAGSAALAARPVAFVEATLRIEGDGLATLHYDAGAGFTAAESHTLEVRRRDGEAVHRFPIANSPISQLRLDLTGGMATTRLSRLAIVSASGRLLDDVPLAGARLAADVTGVERQSTPEGLVIVPSGPVAILQWRLPSPVSAHGARLLEPLRWFWVRVHRRLPWTRSVALWWTPLLVAALVVASLRWLDADAVDGRRPRCVAVAACVTTLGVLAAINGWLAALTWRFYG